VESFHPALGFWERMPSMRQGRCFPAAAVLTEHLYIFGGICEGEPLATAERLDLQTWQWELLPPMSYARVGEQNAMVLCGPLGD